MSIYDWSFLAIIFGNILKHVVNVVVILVYILPVILLVRQFFVWYGQWEIAQDTKRNSRESHKLDIIERKIKITFLAHPQAADLKELDQLLNGLFEQKRLAPGDDESLFVKAFQVGHKVNEMCKVQERLASAKAAVTQIVIGE